MNILNLQVSFPAMLALFQVHDDNTMSWLPVRITFFFEVTEASASTRVFRLSPNEIRSHPPLPVRVRFTYIATESARSSRTMLLAPKCTRYQNAPILEGKNVLPATRSACHIFFTKPSGLSIPGCRLAFLLLHLDPW